MNSFVLILTLVMACLFLGAGIQKALGLRLFASTLKQLGFSSAIAGRIAPIVIVLELSASIALIFKHESVITFGIVSGLAISFAAAGLAAIVHGQRIQCHCFGSYWNGRLGAPQLWMLPLWFGAALLAWRNPPPELSLAGKAAGFAAVCLVIGFVGALRSLHYWHEARGDRLSALEMYVWLR